MSNATGTCARCGRGLKDPESVERGFGPVCWARVQAEKIEEEGGFYDGGDINDIEGSRERGEQIGN